VKGLKVSDYEYPGEQNALDLLKKIPLLDQIANGILKMNAQMYSLPEMEGDLYRVTAETCPELYSLYQTALQRLDMPEEYPLFAKCAFEYNAFASFGSPCVVVYSSILKNFRKDELLFILGHELGHIKSGHSIYQYIAENLRMLVSQIPVVGMEASIGLFYTLHHWYRMHECTADRAGVIAAGSTDAAMRGLGRLMGVDKRYPLVHFSPEELLRQNDSFEEENQDLVTKMICLLYIAESKHPWTVTRVKALHEWEVSGQFQALTARYGG